MNPDNLAISGTADALGQMAIFGKTAVSLLIVVGLIFLVSYFLKRINLDSTDTCKVIRQIAVQALSAREKIVVIQIQEKWLVLGLSGGQINCLSTMDRPEYPNSDPADLISESDMTKKSGFANSLIAAIKSASVHTTQNRRK